MLHSQSNIIGGQCSELATIRQRIQILNGVGLNTNFKFVKQSSKIHIYSHMFNNQRWKQCDQFCELVAARHLKGRINAQKNA